jgi:hypothetical protein
MRKRIPSFALLVLLAGIQVRSHAEQELKPGDMEPYPWVEESDTLRVPKAFLAHLEFNALDHVQGAQIPWSYLSWKFIELYRLTEDETRAVNSALRRRDREVRFAAGRHMKPLEQEASLGGYRSPEGLTVLEQRRFTLEPHAEARQSIMEERDKEIARLLGEERAERLSGHSMYRMPAGSKIIENTVTVTFRLIEIAGLRSVDRVTVHWGGESFSGGPFFEEEDEFAPESLKPVLQRWRAACAEFNRTNAVAVNDSGEVRNTPPTSPAEEALKRMPPAGRSAGWDNAAPYVDIPKALIPHLGVAGIRDAQISPEAKVVFGLGADETAAVNLLFHELRVRFEKLEATQLARANVLSGRFILHRFPDLAGDLKKEWSSRLETLLGSSRGKLLDACIRETSVGDYRRFHRLGARSRPFVFVQGGSVWLNRGEKEVQFDVSMGEGQDAPFSIEFKVLEGEGAGSGGMGGPMKGFPAEVKHLFRPEMFAPRDSQRQVEL